MSDICVGGTSVRSIYFGDQPIQGVCIGSDLIWGFIGFEPLPYQGTTITVHPGKVYGRGINLNYGTGPYEMFELSSTKTITITWSEVHRIGYYVLLGDDGNLYQDFSSLPDGVYGKQIIGCQTDTNGTFSVPPYMSIKHREGTTYYKWSNQYGGAVYTEDRIPDVMTYQVIGDGLYETLRILSKSGDTITTHSNTSNNPVQWTYSGTGSFYQSPRYAYKWTYPNSDSFVLTTTRNPSVGDPYYCADYRDCWIEDSTGPILSVTTDGSGDVATITPTNAASGVYLSFGGQYYDQGVYP